jgi:hypothetical protein
MLKRRSRYGYRRKVDDEETEPQHAEDAEAETGLYGA